MKYEVLQKFNEALEKMADKGKFELAQQGHRATGKGIDSIEAQITNKDLGLLIGAIIAEDYLIPVDTGVPASKIPQRTRGGGGAGKSERIEALINWAKVVKPGLSDNERKSFAFAVDKLHQIHGVPTPGAYKFSKNGRRTNWIDESFDNKKSQDDFERLFDLFKIITDSFESAIK